MKFARGRKPLSEQVPHVQCPYCHRITRGRHKNTNPGHKVFFHDEHGTYETVEEAQAAGLDASQSHVYAHGDDKAFDYEHSYGHITCPDCEPEAMADWERQLRERQEQRALQAQASEEPLDREE